MTSLTTRQRDLLHLLLDADDPLGSAELAANMQLTARQVSYDLKGLKQWLAQRNVALVTTPGVRVALTGTPEQHHRLSAELISESGIQLVLTSEQRQQLLAFILLNAQEPLILYQLQQWAQVSRTTILKGLDMVAEWLVEHKATLERRPNYGIWIKSSESSLLEPWGCVVAAYTQRRRLEPKVGGVMWIIGHADDEHVYEFSAGLEAPTTIVLTDAPALVKALVGQTAAQVIVRDGVSLDGYADLSAKLTEGRGFDDIVLLDPHSAEQAAAVAKLIARRGTFNLVGERPLDGLPLMGVGRLHYDYTAYVGNRGPDIAASYGETRNRCELLVFNPQNSAEPLVDFVMQATDQLGADDVVVSVPVAGLMAEAGTLLNPEGMLVLFAGVPNGTMAPLDLSQVYLHNAQFTGTLGLTLNDQKLVMDRALDGSLSPGRSVAAIGGMNVAPQGIEAMMDGRFPGKIVIFPQIPDLPLMGLDELPEKLPEIAALLDENGFWTNEAETALIEKFWLMA